MAKTTATKRTRAEAAANLKAAKAKGKGKKPKAARKTSSKSEEKVLNVPHIRAMIARGALKASHLPGRTGTRGILRIRLSDLDALLDRAVQS